jgi:hypothetical protein
MRKRTPRFRLALSAWAKTGVDYRRISFSYSIAGDRHDIIAHERVDIVHGARDRCVRGGAVRGR